MTRANKSKPNMNAPRTAIKFLFRPSFFASFTFRKGPKSINIITTAKYGPIIVKGIPFRTNSRMAAIVTVPVAASKKQTPK